MEQQLNFSYAKRRSALHAARVVASFALGGAVFASLGLGWLPALAAVDVHALGAAVGGIAGVIANARHAV